MMNTSDFETELAARGMIVYPNVGTSMMPLLRQHRDLMVIRKKPEGGLKRYDAVLFRRGPQYVLHRILKIREDGYEICGDNQVVKEFVKEEQIIGVLSAVVRDGKEIPVTNPGYRMYVHLWCDFFPIRCFLLRAGRKLKRWIRGR
ncbi:MAG: hypothetical protein MJ175_01975 [Clostridia bacterium]|nr:hypothetical protein [Clostridia bacterium]